MKLESAKPIELDLKEEDELAQELKASCDEDGKEIDAHYSAQLLYRLGQVYHKRTPDKFSLIRSAALYNAALVRNPPNKKAVEKDLQNLCSHILSLADAKIKDAQLIERAKTVKQAILQMRKRVAERLQEVKSVPEDANDDLLISLEIHKIAFFQELQNQITDDYLQIMANLARFCEGVMGEAPCKFALTGMGSIARREITPYSDFENIILLENAILGDECYEEKLNYFRWFSIIFHIVLINIQETIVPSVAISVLSGWFFDAITPRGISFDGMMPHACKFPLGRPPTKQKSWTTELIQPVDQMLQYLKSKESKKNGYHLGDILTKTCFVYKDRNIFAKFQERAFKIIENDPENGVEVKEQLIQDLDSFATRARLSDLKPNEQFNIKQIVYRSTTLFVSALGRINNIRASSSLDIVTELRARNLITDYAKHKLSYSIALACEIRLRWYMKCNKQSDNIGSGQDLVKLVGKKSVLNYFQIAYALQCDISKRLNLKGVHFYSSPVFLNFLNLGYCFADQQLVYQLVCRQQQQASPSKRLLDFDECLKTLEHQPNEHLELNLSRLAHRQNWKYLSKLGDHLLRIGCFDDAVDCFQKSIELIQQNEVTKKGAKQKKANLHKLLVAINHRKIGVSHTYLCKFKAAESHLKKSIKFMQKNCSEEDNNRELAITLKEYGLCLTRSDRFQKAKEFLNKSLQMLEQNSCDIDHDYDVSETLHELGCCLAQLNKMEEATVCFQKEIQIKTQLSTDVEMDREISVTLHELGCCFLKKNRYQEAKSCLQKSMHIKELNSPNVETDLGIAITLHAFACCLTSIHDYVEGRRCLERSLVIIEKISSDVHSDFGVAITLHQLGCCLMKMCKYDEAISCLKRSLRIKKRISADVGSDRNISDTLYELGKCLEEMDDFDEAKDCLVTSLIIDIRLSLSPNLDFDHNIVNTLLQIETCPTKGETIASLQDKAIKAITPFYI